MLQTICHHHFLAAWQLHRCCRSSSTFEYFISRPVKAWKEIFESPFTLSFMIINPLYCGDGSERTLLYFLCDKFSSKILVSSLNTPYFCSTFSQPERELAGVILHRKTFSCVSLWHSNLANSNQKRANSNRSVYVWYDYILHAVQTYLRVCLFCCICISYRRGLTGVAYPLLKGNARAWMSG